MDLGCCLGQGCQDYTDDRTAKKKKKKKRGGGGGGGKEEVAKNIHLNFEPLS